MKTKHPLLLVVTAMFLSITAITNPVRAEDESGGTVPLAKRHSFEIGPEAYFFHYEETEDWLGIDLLVMEEDGIFYGARGSYTYRAWDPPADKKASHNLSGLMLRAEGRYAQGRVEYDGSRGGEPVTISGIDDWTMELRPLIGIDFVGSNSINTIYAGFGYRYLNDDLSDFTGGYERESNYYYLPIGITGTQRTQDGWSVGGTVEFDWLLHGLQKNSHFSDATVPDFENDQKNGYGFRGAFRIERKGKVDFVLEPFVRFWFIDKSEIETIEVDGEWRTAWEPENFTAEMGVNLVVRF